MEAARTLTWTGGLRGGGTVQIIPAPRAICQLWTECLPAVSEPITG